MSQPQSKDRTELELYFQVLAEPTGNYEQAPRDEQAKLTLVSRSPVASSAIRLAERMVCKLKAERKDLVPDVARACLALIEALEEPGLDLKLAWFDRMLAPDSPWLQQYAQRVGGCSTAPGGGAVGGCSGGGCLSAGGGTVYAGHFVGGGGGGASGGSGGTAYGSNGIGVLMTPCAGLSTGSLFPVPDSVRQAAVEALAELREAPSDV